MLLSHSHRFIFIHVFKTGGVSIRAALEPYLYLPKPSWWQRVGQRLRLPGCRPFPSPESHLRAVEARAYLPAKVYDSYFKFAFVRNPWDWHVSFYHFVMEHPEHHRHGVVSQLKNFEEYLHWRAYNAWELQKHYVVDKDGQLLVNFIGRFENLEEDFATVCDKIGVSATLPHLNRSKHRDYRSYYTPSALRVLEQFWGEDIDFFGYQFDAKKPDNIALEPITHMDSDVDRP